MGIQLTLAARYLFGRKLRTSLTTLAVVFGVLVIFAMNTVLPAMVNAFQANLLAASGQVDVTITHESGEAFSDSLLKRVKAVEGVRAAAGSLSRTVNLPAGWFSHDANLSAVSLVGIEPRSAQAVRTYTMNQGRFLRTSDTTGAVITTSLADQLGLKLGDDFKLPAPTGTIDLTVVGLRPPRALPGNEEVLITLYEAQKLFDLPDRINTIDANLDTTDPARRDAIRSAIEAQAGKDYQLGGLASGAELLASIQTGQAAFTLFGFLSLLMGGFIIFNTFRTIVAERRRDIGMLRALGASRPTILGLILVEGVLQGGLGTAIGMALGYLLAAGMLTLMSPLLQQFVHLEIGGPVITPAIVIVSIVLGVGVTLIAGLLPALSASRVTPLEALRPAAAEVAGKVIGPGTVLGALFILVAALGLISGNSGLVATGGLLFLIGLVLVAPALVKPIASVFGGLTALAFARQGTGELAQGNLTRQPSRAAVTASATMIGLALIVAVGGLTTSLSGTFLGILRKSLGSDYLFIPPSIGVWQSDVGADSNLADRLRATRGVGAVSTIRYAGSTVNGKAISVLGIDPVAFPEVSGLNFQEGDSGTAYSELANGRTVIPNGVFAAQSGLKVGDTLTLSTPQGERPYRVVAIAGDYLNSKINTAYISQANLAADFRKTEDVFVQVNLAPGVDPATVEPKLKEIAADYPQFNLVSGRAYYEQNKQIFDVVFVAYYALFLVLALPSLIAVLNTLAIGVIERTREIGMLRAIGSTRQQVSRMVLTEALLLSAIGTAFGLLAGLYLGYVMVSGLGSAGFPVSYSFPVGGLLAAIAVGLIFGVIAAILPARQATHLEIVRALRYE